MQLANTINLHTCTDLSKWIHEKESQLEGISRLRHNVSGKMGCSPSYNDYEDDARF